MDPEKLKLLRSLKLLDKIPEKDLASLEPYLKPVSLKDGEVLFEEGTRGETLYFISSGKIRISKKTSGEEFKDLAILSAGESFGEMAVLDVVARSARAAASGDAGLLELSRADLSRWLAASGELATKFFLDLVQVQNKRLRRTSTEITMIFDLSSLFLEPCPNGKALLSKVLSHVTPHLPGEWSGAAYLYNMFNEEMEPAGAHGSFDLKPLAAKLPSPAESKSVWLDDATFYVTLPGPKRPYGYLIFHASSPVADEERNEFGRALSTVARLTSSALENINFRNEEALRARLGKASQGYGSGL